MRDGLTTDDNCTSDNHF